MGVFDLFKNNSPGNIENSDFENLIKALQSDDLALLQKARENLQALGDPALVPLLQHALVADDKLRTQILIVVQGLSGVSPAGIYTCMKNTCQMEEQEIIRFFATPGKHAIPGLLKLSIENDPDAKLVAVSALVQIGEPAIPLLTKALSHRSYRIRSSAAEALTRMKWEPGSHDEYIQYLVAGKKWSEIIRLKKNAVPPLVGLLQDKYYGIRRDVAKALGATGDARAVLPLIDLLADPEDDVCISAVEALAQINNKTAVPALVKTLSHPSNYVRHMAGTALSEFGWSPSTNEEKVTFLIALERWQDLTRTGKPAIPQLIGIIGDAHQGVQIGAVTALKAMGKPGMDALLAFFNQADPSVRKMITDTLSATSAPAPGKPEAVPKETAAEAPSLPEKNGAVNPLPGVTGAGSKLPVGQHKEFRKFPEPQSGESTQKHTAMKRPDTYQESDPAARAPEQAALKNRTFERPVPTTETHSTRHERQPDFSALTQTADKEDTTEAELASLILSLGNSDENIRTLAVDALERIGIPAIDALSGALRDTSMEVRVAAAEVLGRIGNERAVRPLIDALKDSDEEVRAAAARSLGEIGEFSAFIPLIQTLKDGDLQVRQNAETALVAFGDQAVGPIRKLAVHESPLIRGSSATILGKIGGVGVAQDLETYLSDPEETVRMRASVALGELGSGGIPVLARILQTRDPGLRLCAVIGLGHAGPEAKEYLVLACNDESPIVRERARAFLDAGNETVISSAYLPGLSAVTPGVLPQNPSVPANRALPDPQKLILLLVHPDKDVQITAARDLVGLGDRAVDSLIGALSHESIEVQASASEVLVSMGQPAIDPLIAALASPPLNKQMWAAQILGKINDRRAVPHLIGKLDVAEPRLRQTISEALGYIGDPEAIPHLVRLLD